MSNKKSSKLTFAMVLLWIALMLPLSALASMPADTRVSLNAKSVPVEDVLKQLKQQSGLNFVYSSDLAKTWPKITIRATKKPVEEVIGEIAGLIGCSYEIKGNIVTITRQKVSGRERTIKGYVRDESGDPLIGVPVCIGETQVCSITDVNGFYTFKIPIEQTTLKFSYVGLTTEYVKIAQGNVDVSRDIVLHSDNQIDEVVVNGMFERRKESFTGSTVTFSKDQLESVGNQNLIKSLKNLDPSFLIVENLDMGSNPNALPELQLRGQTSFNIAGDYSGNANEPLFILDGFETTLETVSDLDMNRIKNVTLLKDAAAKAVYGSKAGNGVVVIETVEPRSGKMHVYYNGNLNIEAPDLTGYNLMNAQEKYDWELQHHMYDGVMKSGRDNEQEVDLLQATVYDAIFSEVDTYWLSKPLKTGVGQRHAVQLEGGDTNVRYLLGASYNHVSGVMKGSSRNTFNINSTLSYTFKNAVFRNIMEFTTNDATNSPYGSFSDYVKLAPYYAPYDEHGNVKKILGYQNAWASGFANPVYNPLYNATLNTKDLSGYSTFSDNFEVDWHINDHYRLTGKFTYKKNNFSSDVFYPASHTLFVEYDQVGNSDRKGQYTKTNGYDNTISAQAGLSWNQQFGRHSFFVNGTWNLYTNNYKSVAVRAEGFGNDQMNDITMATYYYHDSHPTGYDSKTRELGVVGTFNYSFDDRYLFDASLRETGSSVFGSDNHWGTFWSLGVGWNIHNEHFISKDGMLKQLKLRYSLGYTGTQNFNPYQARAQYSYGDIIYDGRLATNIIALPNTSLKWQKVYDNNWGVDMALGNWLTMRFDYYVQNTDNMLTDITLPSSSGFTSYKENLGEIQNKGMELMLGITPWRDNSTRSWLTFTFSAAHNKNKIKKIYDIFNKTNAEADSKINETISSDRVYDLTAAEYNEWMKAGTRPATKYYEGCSMTAIWGLRSLGIDPASGNEMYLDKNDNVTYTWNSADQVVIGDTNPKWHGTMGINGGWNGFTLAVVASYKYGGDLYNTTLIDRVENISGYGNLDKRVFEVWTNPGDIAPYRGVQILSQPYLPTINRTKPTSRFVQRNNELYISSINVAYDFYKAAWLKHIGLERLKLAFYANELCRISSIKTERGLSYPFARTFSFSVNATF